MAPHQLDEEPLQPNASAHGAGNNLVLVSDVLPDRLTILPLRERPIFPGLTLPLVLSGRQYLEALRLASDHQPPHPGRVAGAGSGRRRLFRLHAVPGGYGR